MKKIRIFTDGACSENPGPGGWASVFCKEEECKQFSGGEAETTNNRMELYAIKFTLEKILKCSKKYDYEIYSDSAYCINSIKNKWLFKWANNNWESATKEPVKNQDLWKEVLKFLNKAEEKNISITFHKIKGHAGNTFNELADSIAKKEVLKIKEGEI